MKARTLALTLAAALASCLVLPAQAQKKASAPKTLPGGWVLAWHDEFNGRKLNHNKWIYELGVIRNQGASQSYTQKAVKLKGGKLVITARHQETPNSNFREGATHWTQQIRTQPYSSGSIKTKGKMSFKPGCRLEVRAKLPAAKGAWPAIWLIHENGEGWPACGETDMMEHITQETNVCYSTFHWGDKGSNKHKSQGSKRKFESLTNEWHVYYLEWTNEEMVLGVDKTEIARLKLDSITYPEGKKHPFRSPAHLILNLAIGGPGTWPEKPDAAQFPCHYEIDYVRYYRKK